MVVFAHSHQDPALFFIKTHRTQRQQEYKKSFREMLKSETGGTAKTTATVYDAQNILHYSKYVLTCSTC